MATGYPQFAAYLLGAQGTAIAEIQTNVNAVKADVAMVKTDVAAVKNDAINKTLTKPRTALFAIATTVALTWYTVLDVSGLKGKVNRIFFSPTTAPNCEIEITVDGVTSVITGISGNYVGAEVDTAVMISHMGCEYFDSSLRVRIRQATGTTAEAGHVDYTLI